VSSKRTAIDNGFGSIKNRWIEILMSEAKFNAWKVLSLALQACVYICFGLWIYVTSTVCSAPSAPDAVTGNVIAYNCHGSMVFISRTQDILLKGLVPALVVAGVSGLAARKRAKSSRGDAR
jgi:hypothetical protein